MGIPTIVYYPLPLHKQKAYKNIFIKNQLKNSEIVSKKVLSIPIYPEIPKKNLIKIIKSLNIS